MRGVNAVRFHICLGLESVRSDASLGFKCARSKRGKGDAKVKIVAHWFEW